MTCIVAVSDGERVVMGGDAMSHNGHTVGIHRSPKVMARDGVAMGTCGTHRFNQLLRYALEVPDLPISSDDAEEWCVMSFVPRLRGLLVAAEHLSNGGEGDKKGLWQSPGNVLVGVLGRIFKIRADFECGQNIESYDAEGSGDEVALGALYVLEDSGLSARARCERALAAAARHSPHVRGPFSFVEVGDSSPRFEIPEPILDTIKKGY